MEKVMVIGCPGSGKSTFSKTLHQITGLPLFHLDLLFWTADGKTVERSVFLRRLSQVQRQEKWILDGDYISTMEQRMKACDTVFFLDYPVKVCLDGINERVGKIRSDLPWTETQEDPGFRETVERYQAEKRPKVTSLLKQYSHKNIFIFSSRLQADLFLKSLKEKNTSL